MKIIKKVLLKPNESTYNEIQLLKYPEPLQILKQLIT